MTELSHVDVARYASRFVAKPITKTIPNHWMSLGCAGFIIASAMQKFDQQLEARMSLANDNNAAIIWSHIELMAGTVKSSNIECAWGTVHTLAYLGQFRFYVRVIDANGASFGLHSCDDYEEAIRLAERARVDFEILIPVVDNVVGSH